MGERTELRWVQVPHTTTKPAVLQYRRVEDTEDGRGHATGWENVPVVVLEAPE